MTQDLPPDAVRRLNDGVVEVMLPPELLAVRMARRFIAGEWTNVSPDVMADTSLIATELVANAVQHGAPDICLRLRAAPFALDLGVVDHGGGTPRLMTAGEVENRGSGRGLAIVDRLAAAWGVDPLEGGDRGKLVWASIDRC